MIGFRRVPASCSSCGNRGWVREPEQAWPHRMVTKLCPSWTCAWRSAAWDAMPELRAESEGGSQ